MAHGPIFAATQVREGLFAAGCCLVPVHDLITLMIMSSRYEDLTFLWQNKSRERVNYSYLAKMKLWSCMIWYLQMVSCSKEWQVILLPQLVSRLAQVQMSGGIGLNELNLARFRFSYHSHPFIQSKDSNQKLPEASEFSRFGRPAFASEGWVSSAQNFVRLGTWTQDSNEWRKIGRRWFQPGKVSWQNSEVSWDAAS